MRQRNWNEAFESLSAVIRARPSYKDAEKLLQRAERGQQGKTGRTTIAGLGLGHHCDRRAGAGGWRLLYSPMVFPISAEEYYSRGVSRQSNLSYDLAIADFTQAIALQRTMPTPTTSAEARI